MQHWSEPAKVLLELPPPPVVLNASVPITYEQQPGTRVCDARKAGDERIAGYNTPEDCQAVLPFPRDPPENQITVEERAGQQL